MVILTYYGGDYMNANSITDKEIQFNIMMALMKIEGHLSDLVNQGEVCEYQEVIVNDTSGISQ
jgi:hypothetical protein